MIDARCRRCVVVLAAIGSVLPLSPALDAWQGGSSAAAVEAESDESEVAVVSEEIEVVEDEPVVPAVRILSREELPGVPIGDGADLLRGVAGVAVGRMGGHGLEPRIRGLAEGNLNVQIDGAYLHGGCPNRMDPPSSFVSPDAFDEVTVIKGVPSMRYGPGGTAGTVLYERKPPDFAEPTGWRAELTTAHGSWHRNPELAFDASLGMNGFFLRAQGGTRSFDDYEDGDGNVVRSAFESRHANLMLGYGEAATGQFELGIEASRTDDALFAGAGMDSPQDAADTDRLGLRRSEPWLGLRDQQGELYYSGVDHLMDNYSLRTLTAPMAMRVPSTSNTSGGRVGASRQMGERILVTLGARWDRFGARAREADLEPAGMNLSPNQLYELYYGYRSEDWSASEWGALVRCENRSDERPLAQIPPLQGRLQLGYRVDKWSAEGRLRWATAQTRVDDDPTTGSGQDYGETPGHGVLDLSGSCRIPGSLTIFAGVDNVFDRTYANHLNRANLFDPESIQINEPGRTLWIKLAWRGGAF